MHNSQLITLIIKDFHTFVIFLVFQISCEGNEVSA